MFQKQKGNGIYAGEGGFGPEDNLGDLEVAHWHPENSNDEWAQAALTVEGKFSNFDITFASSYLKRDVDVNSDYSDYAFFYDTIDGYGTYFYDNAGELINPSQFINGKDGYTKTSNELRISTSAENRWRFVGGLFAQRQTHDIQQEYKITGLNDDSDVTGFDDTFWLTKQWRVDRDMAAYGEVTFNATEKLAFTGGARYFRTENSLEGFFGFGATNPYGIEHRRRLLLRHRPDVRNRALYQSRQDREAERHHVPLQRHVPCHRRRDVLRHVVGRFPSGRRQPPRYVPALQGGLPHQLRNRLEDRVG